MTYLFECTVIIYGAPGGTAYYIVYKSDNSYWCKMKWWRQYGQHLEAGDFALWKDKTWKHTGSETPTKSIAEQIGKFIEEWEMYSDSYREELRKGFRYLGELP